MKWFKLILTILEYILPFVAKKGKNNLAQELEIARKTIEILSRDKTSQEKGAAIEEAVTVLWSLSGSKDRSAKWLKKAKARFWKKVF